MFDVTFLMSQDENYIRNFVRTKIDEYIESNYPNYQHLAEGEWIESDYPYGNLVEHESEIRDSLEEIFWNGLPTYQSPITTWIHLGCDDNAVKYAIYSDDQPRSFEDLMEESCNYTLLELIQEEITIFFTYG